MFSETVHHKFLIFCMMSEGNRLYQLNMIYLALSSLVFAKNYPLGYIACLVCMILEGNGGDTLDFDF